MESIKEKIVNIINLGSNKVCVVSLTNFINFLILSLLNIIFERKNFKKMKMQMTEISSILWGASTKGNTVIAHIKDKINILFKQNLLYLKPIKFVWLKIKPKR